MNDRDIVPPAALDAILQETARIGFTMASERQTGSFLRTLAASKPGGRLLELGTGTGVGTSWLLAGMDSSAQLESVDNDAEVQAVARRHLGADARVTFHHADAADFLAQSPPSRFDLVYADAWAGKFSHLELALGQLRSGGIYVIDDLLPQPNWPDGHGAKIEALVDDLERRQNFAAVKLAWASGLMILARTC
jgi:predicted O-methyltransferase YrrM